MTTDTRLRGIVGIVATLVIGMALGVALDRFALRPSEAVAAQPRVPQGAMIASLTEDLALTPVQVGQIHEILNRHQSVVEQAWETTHNTLMAALDSVTSQVETVLDPGQVAAYHDWIDVRHRGAPVRPNHPAH